jgi:hypothetical protein
LASSFKVDETIKYVIFFQLLNFAESGGVDVFGWLVETTVETGLLGDALKRAVNIAGSHFGVVFSFFDGDFSFEFSILVFESLTEYFGLSFLEVVLGDNFLKVMNLFFVEGNFVFEVVDLNHKLIFFLFKYFPFLPYGTLEFIQFVLIQVNDLLFVFEVVFEQLGLFLKLLF